GDWEGLTSQEIKERWPVEYANWTIPNGEPAATVAVRVADAIRRWADRLEDEDGVLVVVSHGAAIRFGLAHLLGLPEELWHVLGGLSNCSWSVVEQSRSGWRLMEHNAGTLPEPVRSDDIAVQTEES